MRQIDRRACAAVAIAGLQLAVLIGIYVFQTVAFRKAPLFEMSVIGLSGGGTQSVNVAETLPTEGPGAVSGLCWNALMDGSGKDSAEQVKETAKKTGLLCLTEPRPREKETDLCLPCGSYLYVGGERQPQLASFWKLQPSGRWTFVRAAVIGSDEDAVRDGEMRLIADAALYSDGVGEKTLPPSLAWAAEAAKEVGCEVRYLPRKELCVRLALPQSGTRYRYAHASYTWHDEATWKFLTEQWTNDRPSPAEGAERGGRAVLALPNGNPKRAVLVDLLLDGRSLGGASRGDLR